MKIIWKDINEYEDIYAINIYGNIVNKKFNKLRKIDSSGNYDTIALCKNNKVKHFLVHRLLAQHFIPNPKNKPEVNHVDGNKKNNNINNLEWCTRSENQKHSHNIGLTINQRKKQSDRMKNESSENSRRAILKEKEVLEIKELYKSGSYTQLELSSIYGVHKDTIGDITRNKTWNKLKTT